MSYHHEIPTAIPEPPIRSLPQTHVWSVHHGAYLRVVSKAEYVDPGPLAQGVTRRAGS